MLGDADIAIQSLQNVAFLYVFSRIYVFFIIMCKIYESSIDKHMQMIFSFLFFLGLRKRQREKPTTASITTTKPKTTTTTLPRLFPFKN